MTCQCGAFDAGGICVDCAKCQCDHPDSTKRCDDCASECYCDKCHKEDLDAECKCGEDYEPLFVRPPPDYGVLEAFTDDDDTSIAEIRGNTKICVACTDVFFDVYGGLTLCFDCRD